MHVYEVQEYNHGKKEHYNFRLLLTSGERWRSLIHHLKLVRNKIKNINIIKEKQLWFRISKFSGASESPSDFSYASWNFWGTIWAQSCKQFLAQKPSFEENLKTLHSMWNRWNQNCLGRNWRADPGWVPVQSFPFPFTTTTLHRGWRLADISLQNRRWVTSKASSPSDSLCNYGTIYFLNINLHEIKLISQMSACHTQGLCRKHLEELKNFYCE